MRYEVTYAAEETVINVDGIKAKVSLATLNAGTTFALGTVYINERGGFVPVKIYQFQAMNNEANAEGLKGLADIFFGSLLDPDLYVVEITRDSALFSEEAQRIFGTRDYERAI